MFGPAFSVFNLKKTILLNVRRNFLLVKVFWKLNAGSARGISAAWFYPERAALSIFAPGGALPRYATAIASHGTVLYIQYSTVLYIYTV